VAWFTFDPCLGPPELQFSEDNCTVSCEGYEHRVALGSVGFSRGVHYWEFSINRYDSDTDPSFGIARLDVAKDQMLGKNWNQVKLLFIRLPDEESFYRLLGEMEPR
jgi:tripartite motif-containing protein 9/67